MNSRERILAALSCQQSDRVPIFGLQIDEPVILDLAQLLGVRAGGRGSAEALVHSEESTEILDLYAQIVLALGLDAACYPFSIGYRRLAGDGVVDKYGCRYCLSEHGSPMVVAGPIETRSDLAGYDMASRLVPGDFAKLQHVMRAVGPDKAHFVALTDPFKASWLLRGGMDNLLVDYSWDPQLVRALARVTTDLAMAAIDYGANLGVDVMIVEGDLAGEITTLMSPKHYRRFVKPYHHEVVEHAHRRGLKICKHTDGNAAPILVDLMEAGFDGFHPVQPQCMDIGATKAATAGRLCLIGNIDCRDLLPFGSPEQVTEAVRHTIAIAAPGGGFILSSSNSIHTDCRAENYVAMVHAAREYGALADTPAEVQAGTLSAPVK